MGSIERSFHALSSTSDFVVVEGTGHTGVGSICDLSNAHVAAKLGVDAVLVCLGGLGSSFDQLAMNRAMLEVLLSLSYKMLNYTVEERARAGGCPVICGVHARV